LKIHEKWICLQVAVDEWERQKLQDETRQEKEGKLIDLML
jgi:hypothetical protein